MASWRHIKACHTKTNFTYMTDSIHHVIKQTTTKALKVTLAYAGAM